MTERPLAAKGERPFFLSSPDSDVLLNIIIALTGEVSALQDKLDRAINLAAKGEPFDPAVLDEDVPDENAAKRDAMLQRVYRILLAMHEQEQAAPTAYSDVMAALSGERE